MKKSVYKVNDDIISTFPLKLQRFADGQRRTGTQPRQVQGLLQGGGRLLRVDRVLRRPRKDYERP